MSNNLNVILRVDGGLVDSVFIPPNVEVIVRDYDIVSDCDPTLICEDEDGNRYVELVYMPTGGMLRSNRVGTRRTHRRSLGDR